MIINPIKILEYSLDCKELFFLDSAINKHVQGRYSFLGANPIDVVKAQHINGLRGRIRLPAVGVIGYDGHARFGLYDSIVVIDHLTGKISVKSFGLAKSKSFWQERLNAVKTKTIKQQEVGKQNGSLTLKATMNRSEYERAVKKTLQHIHDGDIYQLNLTYERRGQLTQLIEPQQAYQIYCHLREQSATHLCAFLRFDGQYVLSSSPERFLSFDKNFVTLSPMKGTRPRGKDRREDMILRRELNDNPKERAELLMVTDLARNDLGRVCRVGSVEVSQLRNIETYSKVFQATATVTGKLKPNCDVIDALNASFPSGSVTGCPKLAAMGIIKSLEKNDRNLYTGALGYLNFLGKADFNVMIRTIYLKGKDVSFHVGSGIVADSNPKAEYEETLLKSKGMVEALAQGLSTKVILR